MIAIITAIIIIGMPLLTAWAMRRLWQRVDRYMWRGVWRRASSYDALRGEQDGLKPARPGYLNYPGRGGSASAAVFNTHPAAVRRWHPDSPTQRHGHS